MKSSLLKPAFLLLVSLRLDAGVLENATELLGDENFQRREQAEADLKKAGPEALRVVEPLLHADDPEIKIRAQRIYDGITCGIDERMPAEIASDLPDFDTLPPDRQSDVVSGLAGLDPPHLTGLASLHSRLFAMPLPEEKRQPLLLTVEAGIRKAVPPEEMAPFGLWPFDVRTRALLVNLAVTGQSADLKETYAEWQKRDPNLRTHLDGNAVMLEVERLRAEWDKRGALAFVSEIRDEQAFQVVIREFRDWMLGDPTLDIAALGEPEAIGYLELVFESPTPGNAISLIRKLRESIPDLAGKIRPSRSAVIQAIAHWEAEKQAEAASVLCGKGKEIRDGEKFLAEMIADANRVDIEAIAAAITTSGAEKLLENFLSEPLSNPGLVHAISLSTILRERGGLTRESVFAGRAGEDLALDLWKRNQDDLCYRVMEEAFWGMDGWNHSELVLFPALAVGMGRLTDALVTAAEVTTESKSRGLKMAYLFRAAGRLEEALAYSAKFPESHVHQQLLIDSRNWSALSKIGKPVGKDWFAFLDGDRENWRGQVPDTENASALLRLMLEDYGSLIPEVLGIDRDEVHAGHFGRALAEDAFVGSLLHERMAAALDGGTLVSPRDFDSYFGHPEMIRDKDAAADLLGRLNGQPAPPATIEGIRTALSRSPLRNKFGDDPPRSMSSEMLRTPHPMIGFSGDPRAESPDLLHGISEAQKIYEDGDERAASQLAVDLALRIVIDRRVRESSYGMAGGGHVSGDEKLMRGFMVRDTPRKVALPAAKILALINRGWKGQEETARFFAMHGEYGSACEAYHRLCAAKLQERFSYGDIEKAGYLVELEIRRAMAMGTADEAAAIYLRHHRLMPYAFTLQDDLMGHLREAGAAESLRKLDEAVSSYWDGKLKTLPDAVPYRQALEHWRETMAGS